MNPTVPVIHNDAAHRFEAVVEGHLSVCEYTVAGNDMVFTHTLVPSVLRGRGLAELLVRAGLAEARATGRRVVPHCSYVARFIERHPEFQDLLGG